MNKNRNYVSTRFWVLSFFVLGIPLVNIVYALVWAILGKNETRKNFFRAFLAFWALTSLALVALFFLKLYPRILDAYLPEWLRQR